MFGQNKVRSLRPGSVAHVGVFLGAVVLLTTGCGTPALFGQPAPLVSGPPRSGTYRVDSPAVGTTSPQGGPSGVLFQLRQIVVHKRYAVFYGAVINDTGSALTMVSGLYGGDAYYQTARGKKIQTLPAPNFWQAVSTSFGRGSGEIQTPSAWHNGAAVLGWMRFPTPPGRTITFVYPPFKPITVHFAG